MRWYLSISNLLESWEIWWWQSNDRYRITWNFLGVPRGTYGTLKKKALLERSRIQRWDLLSLEVKFKSQHLMSKWQMFWCHNKYAYHGFWFFIHCRFIFCLGELRYDLRCPVNIRFGINEFLVSCLAFTSWLMSPSGMTQCASLFMSGRSGKAPWPDPEKVLLNGNLKTEVVKTTWGSHSRYCGATTIRGFMSGPEYPTWRYFKPNPSCKAMRLVCQNLSRTFDSDACAWH